MKVDNNDARAARNAASAARSPASAELVAQSGNVLLLADSFKAALQRARRREEPDREEPRPRSSSRTTPRPTTRAAEPSAEPPAALRNPSDTKDGASCAAYCEEWRPRSPLTAVRTESAQALVTTQPHELFRLRRSGGGNSRSCIEVVHSRTGTRFLLSRDGDVWLLAVKSESVPQPAELRSIVAALNAQFAERGLGAVDVIIHES